MTLPGNDSLQVATFNCRSIRNSLIEVQELCRRSDVVLLQETWLLPHNLAFLNSIDHTFLSHGISAVDTGSEMLTGRPYGGLAVLWRRELGECITIVDTGDPRLLGMILRTSSVTTLILNVYLPTADSDNSDSYRDYLGKIYAIVEDSGTENIIISGDWNAHEGRPEFLWLSEFCSDLDLVIADKIFLPTDTFTFVSDAHQTTSWLDHIIMSPSCKNVCTNMNVSYGYIMSDHKPILFSIALEAIPRLVENRTAPTFNIRWENCTPDDIKIYQHQVNSELSNIFIPTKALLCHGCDHNDHKHDIGVL